MNSFATTEFSFKPYGPRQGRPIDAVSSVSFLASRVSQIGILLVVLNAVAHGQQVPATDAQVKQADELATKGGAANLSRAFHLYEQAALAGNLRAMNETGRCYRNGTGVQRDYRKAAEWYGKAAATGDTRGMRERRMVILAWDGSRKGLPEGR